MNKISKKDIFLSMKSMEQMEMDYDFVSFFFQTNERRKIREIMLDGMKCA